MMSAADIETRSFPDPMTEHDPAIIRGLQHESPRPPIDARDLAAEDRRRALVGPACAMGPRKSSIPR